jgi:hypothetical protein
MKAVMFIVSFTLLFWGTAVQADMPKGKYLEGKDSKVAVILAHGQGLNPDSQVVSPLRKYMKYGPKFPEAHQTIQAGIDFLKKEKGVEPQKQDLGRESDGVIGNRHVRKSNLAERVKHKRILRSSQK